MKRSLAWALALLALILHIPVGAQDVLSGKQMYGGYCAGCHGADGKGNGWMAKHLSRRPSPLASLARDYGGAFPVELVRHVIDGRRQVELHGPREMPIWGFVFQEDFAQGYMRPKLDEALARQRIDALIGYLKQIQE